MQTLAIMTSESSAMDVSIGYNNVLSHWIYAVCLVTVSLTAGDVSVSGTNGHGSSKYFIYILLI